MTAAPYSGSVTLVFRKTGPGDGKAYLARIVGLDPKFGFKRDFLVSGLVTDPGIYEAVSYHYGKREGGFHVVLPVEGKLQVVKAREQTVVELLQAGRPVTDLRTITDEKGRLTFRKDGELMWAEPSPPIDPRDAEALAMGLGDLRTWLGQEGEPKTMTVDPRSYELAEHFLPVAAPEQQVRELAEHIQAAVEDWLRAAEQTQENHKP